MNKAIVCKLIAALLLLAVPAGKLCAAEIDAADLYRQGRELYLAEEYYDAADKFEKCYMFAANATVRGNALLAQIGAYRMCKLYYREFEAIEKLLERHMEFADYKTLVDREYEIAGLYHDGHRDPAFWALRFIPWLTDEDRTEAVLTKALKRAPFAPQAPQARLKLAYYYEMNGMTEKSLTVLRELLKNHPEAPECRFAMLALANGLFELARHGGDGDGRRISESLEIFNKFLKKYPKAPETDFVNRKVAASRDIQAKHLAEMAEFYRKRGRSETARTYLSRLMQQFPDSQQAPEAEKELVELDRTYLPGEFPARSTPRLPDVRTYAIPEGAERELISPYKESNDFLLPVPDLSDKPDVKGKNNK